MKSWWQVVVLGMALSGHALFETLSAARDEQLIKDKHYPNYSGQLHTKLFEAKWYHSLWYLKYRKVVNRILAMIIGTGAIVLLAS